MYPSSTAMHGEGSQWLMFFEQAGAPNWFVDKWQRNGIRTNEDRRAYTEFPGVGEYMCFDASMLAELEEHAHNSGREPWCASLHSLIFQAESWRSFYNGKSGRPLACIVSFTMWP